MLGWERCLIKWFYAKFLCSLHFYVDVTLDEVIIYLLIWVLYPGQECGIFYPRDKLGVNTSWMRGRLHLYTYTPVYVCSYLRAIRCSQSTSVFLRGGRITGEPMKECVKCHTDSYLIKPMTLALWGGIDPMLHFMTIYRGIQSQSPVFLSLYNCVWVRLISMLLRFNSFWPLEATSEQIQSWKNLLFHRKT